MSVDLMPHSAVGVKASCGTCAYQEARGARLNRNSLAFVASSRNGRQNLVGIKGPPNLFAALSAVMLD